MNKLFSVLAVLMLIITLSCDSAGSGSDENPAEAAGALAAAGAVMGVDDYNPPLVGSPPVLFSPPARDARAPEEYSDGLGGTATYYFGETDTIEFDNFHTAYSETQYVLNGNLICSYIPPDGVTAFAISFEGDVAVEGGSLSGTYTVNIDAELDLSFPEDGYSITGTITGTVDGEDVDITIDEIIPYPL